MVLSYEVKMIDRKFGNAVLELFAELRMQTLEVLDQAELIARASGKAGERAQPHIAAARHAVDQSRLNLVVVGGEGQGKSTLINALLGVEEVTPVDARRPGTVAPVFISYGAVKTPMFYVQTTKNDGQPLYDVEAFKDFLLQARNKNNEKGVRAGRVVLQHPLLENGLQIVDMPGVEGVSPSVAKEAQDFIRKSAHTIIGVVRRAGGFGPMGRILSDMLPVNTDPQALVFNSEVTEWLVGPGEVKSETELSDYIAEQRQIVSNQMRPSCPVLGEHAERIFVLNLPSLQGAVRRGWVKSPVHIAEETRLLAHIWDHVRRIAVDQVILQATQAAEQAVRELEAWLDLRRRMLASLVDGRSSEVLSKFKEADQAAQRIWQKVYCDNIIDQQSAKTWQQLKLPMQKARDQLNDGINVAKLKAGEEEGSLSDTVFNYLKADLELAVVNSQTDIESAQSVILNSTMAFFIEHANSALEEINIRVPIVRDSIGKLEIDAQSVIRLKVGSTDPSVVERIMHAAGTLGTAGVAGSLAGGAHIAILTTLFAINPFVGLVIGAGVGGFVGQLVSKRLLDTNRRGLSRALSDLKRDAAAIDTSDHSDLRTKWNETVRELAAGVNGALQERVKGIATVVSNPGSSFETLKSVALDNERLAGELTTLESTLTLIASRAAPPQ
jgi:hypothetical protein